MRRSDSPMWVVRDDERFFFYWRFLYDCLNIAGLFQFSRKKKTQKFLFLRDPFREDFICFPFGSNFFLLGKSFIFPSLTDPKFLFLLFCFSVSSRVLSYLVFFSVASNVDRLCSLSLIQISTTRRRTLICCSLEVLIIFLALNLYLCLALE